MLRFIPPVPILLGTLGYLLLTFPLAYGWHLVAFEQTYRDLGYFSRAEPIVSLGFTAILLQGILLSFLYPRVARWRSPYANLFTFVVVMGGYHWTMHVVAEAAKHPIEPLSSWFALESAYLLIQFTGGGLWLGWVYRDRCAPT